jgi:hypothetical protein
MAHQQNSGITEEFLKHHAFSVNTDLKGKCKWCPRGFERGEKIIFLSIKNIQMEWLEEDIEAAEPAGFGERHHVKIVNAHLPCAVQHLNIIRSVVNPHGSSKRLK